MLQPVGAIQLCIGVRASPAVLLKSDSLLLELGSYLFQYYLFLVVCSSNTTKIRLPKSIIVENDMWGLCVILYQLLLPPYMHGAEPAGGGGRT